MKKIKAEKSHREWVAAAQVQVAYSTRTRVRRESPRSGAGGQYTALNSEFSGKCKLTHPSSSVNPKLEKHEEQNQNDQAHLRRDA